jgi:hypothetical protein
MPPRIIACLLLAVALSFAGVAAAGAAPLRFPDSGAPAFVLDVPAGWTGSPDQAGNYAIVADDHCCAVALSMVTDQALLDSDNEDVANKLFEAANVKPSQRSEGAIIGGVGGETFFSQNGDGTMNLNVTILRIDPGHMAIVSAVIRADASEEIHAKAADLISSITFANSE